MFNGCWHRDDGAVSRSRSRRDAWLATWVFYLFHGAYVGLRWLKMLATFGPAQLRYGQDRIKLPSISEFPNIRDPKE